MNHGFYMIALCCTVCLPGFFDRLATPVYVQCFAKHDPKLFESSNVVVAGMLYFVKD